MRTRIQVLLGNPADRDILTFFWKLVGEGETQVNIIRRALNLLREYETHEIYSIADIMEAIHRLEQRSFATIQHDAGDDNPSEHNQELNFNPLAYGIE
jgi:hypothetical protein